MKLTSTSPPLLLKRATLFEKLAEILSNEEKEDIEIDSKDAIQTIEPLLQIIDNLDPINNRSTIEDYLESIKELLPKVKDINKYKLFSALIKKQNIKTA